MSVHQNVLNKKKKMFKYLNRQHKTKCNLLVRETIVVPSMYCPPESNMTGSLSVITISVSLNVSKCGIDECGPNATVVLNDSP